MAEFLYGLASGVGLCIGLVTVLGLYVKTHQEKMMRLFIRRAMGGRNGGPKNSASQRANTT